MWILTLILRRSWDTIVGAFSTGIGMIKGFFVSLGTGIANVWAGVKEGAMMAQNVIVGRTNSSFSGLNTVMSFASSLIITKEQVDRVVMAVRNAIEKGF